MRCRLSAIGIVIATLALAPAALARTYKPNTTGDGVPNGCSKSNCTLREAIISANARPGADKIILKAKKTYALSIPKGTETDNSVIATGDLDLNDAGGSALTIESSGKKLAKVDARGVDRVFQCFRKCTLVRLRIQGGKTNDDGGGVEGEDQDVVNDISGGGRIILKLSRVVGNSGQGDGGGGIAADTGGLVVSKSVISSNTTTSSGGGIFVSEGSVSISKSTIQGNVATGAGGGGLAVVSDGATDTGHATVSSSTISANSASGAGGQGGGILAADATSSLSSTNSTITGNSAVFGGGIYSGGAAVSLNALTVARNTASNGGGSFAALGSPAGSVRVANTLIAANTAGLFPDCSWSLGVVASNGHDLFGNSTGCSPVAGDIVNVDARIGKLKNNGGLTKTIELKKRSPAINHGGSDAPKRDQRGEKRKKPDIGAFERQ
jgi:CSLREA domain-containing protein